MTPSHASRLVELMRRVERIEIPVAAIKGIHPEVPVECIDSYPKREDDYLRLTDTAVSMLLLQHPVGVVDDSPQEPGRNRKYLVVSGLDTWRAVLAHRLQVPAAKPRGRKPKVQQRPSFDNIPVVTYTAADSSEDIKLLALADLWLKLTALQSDSGLRDTVLVRAQELVGRTLLSELTPNIVSLRSLAGFLGHRSHARLSQVRQRSPQPAAATSRPEADEEPDERAGPVS